MTLIEDEDPALRQKALRILNDPRLTRRQREARLRALGIKGRRDFDDDESRREAGTKNLGG